MAHPHSGNHQEEQEPQARQPEQLEQALKTDCPARAEQTRQVGLSAQQTLPPLKAAQSPPARKKRQASKTRPSREGSSVIPAPDAAVLPEELQQENTELRRRLEEVVATATLNEKIWRHFVEIERILFRTRQLDVLVEELLGEIKTRFQPDQLVLLLCHPDVLERFFPDLSEASEPIGEGTWLLPIAPEVSRSICGEAPKPHVFSSKKMGKVRPLLPKAKKTSAIRSGVLIPLCIHQVLFGGLFLGSKDAGRYSPSDGTDLLEQLGIKIALCMDNCLTYERVKDFAMQDPLTGLLNFFQIHTALERELRKAIRMNTPLSLLMIDLNFFHEVNGQPVIGNDVLKHVADLLRETLPEEDAILGRYGSGEFLILLPNVQEDEAREVVPYLTRKIFKAPFMHGNTAILIQSVIGVGSLDEETKRPQDLLDAAYTEVCRARVKPSPPATKGGPSPWGTDPE